MIKESNQIFRITYEAFSKFSNSLNRCRAFDEIAGCFTVNLKYLFNYHVFRASYFQYGTCVHVESTAGNTTLTVDSKTNYLEYEKLLLNTNIPQKWTAMEDLQLPQSFTVIEEEHPELWGWNFVSEERNIMVSIYSGSRKRFSQRDINFLSLVSDNLETKLIELCLIKELDKKNNIITKIIEDQKEVIKDRTREIENKNKTLLEISVQNAHKVREPLSRIIGLINLLDEEGSEQLIKEIVPLIKISSDDLDSALKNVINHATKGLWEYKA